MTLEKIEQHTERAIVSLAPPFWGKPRIAAFLAAFADRIQSLEDDLWEIMESRTIDAGDLVRLKVIGRFIGQPRLTFDLETYRKVLKARARANVSKGTRTDILAVLTILLGPGEYEIVELGNATLYITALSAVPDIRPVLAVLPDTRAAGVGLHFLYSDSDPITDTFLWGDDWSTTEEWAGVVIL